MSPSILSIYFIVSPNVFMVLQVNCSANLFVFGDNVHYKDWLNYSGGTDRPGELCCDFCFLN